MKIRLGTDCKSAPSGTGIDASIEGMGNMVAAKQEVNPDFIGKMSDANGKPGADMLHEVTEAYQGAMISSNNGYPSPNAGQSGSVYPSAHASATDQSGQLDLKYYDGSGNQLRTAEGVSKAVWSVTDKIGTEIILQTYP